MIEVLAAERLGSNMLLAIGPALVALALIFWVALVYYFSRRANINKIRYGETLRGPSQGGVIHAGALEAESAERREWLADEAADEMAEVESREAELAETRRAEQGGEPTTRQSTA